MVEFGSIGEQLQIVVRKTDDTILTDVSWDDIVWSEVKEIGLKSSNHVIGFHKNLGCIVWYPLMPFIYDKPLFYIFQKAWGKIGANWHRFYITTSGTQRTPYHTLNEDILPDERKMGWTGTISYGGYDFPVDIAIRGEPLGLPQSLKTKITTPIDLDDMGIEYQFYLNPDWAPFTEKNIKWVRVYTVWEPPSEPSGQGNYEYTDYNITQFMELTDIPSLPIYAFEFYNQDKSECLGHFNFDDIFRESQNRFAKIEQITLPNNETTYCIRIGATFGSKSAGDSFEVDPDFGWKTIETSDWGCGGSFKVFMASPASDGNADTITVYLKNWDSGEAVKCALYDDAGDGTASLVDETASRTTGGTDDWYTFTFATPPAIYSAKNYAIGCIADTTLNAVYIKYDSETGYTIKYGDMAFDPLETPVTWYNTYANYVISIYCNYTAAAAAAVPTPDIYIDTTVYDDELYIPPTSYGDELSLPGTRY